MILWLVGLMLLVQGKHLMSEMTDKIPWVKINTTLFSNITQPAFPDITLYSGAVDDVHFMVESCQKEGCPYLFWVDDVGRSSLVSWLFESGCVRLGKKGDNYTISNNTQPLSKQFNVVYVDMAGVGMSEGNASTSIEESVCQLQTVIEAIRQQLNESNFKYYVAGRGYNSIVVAQLAQSVQDDEEEVSSSPLGVILINSKPHPQAILTSISDHTYNMGLINYQEKIKADQMTLLLSYQLSKQINIYKKYQQFLTNVSKWGGLQHHDYYLNHSQVDASVVQSFMNQPNVKNAFNLTKFKQYNEDIVNQYSDLFKNTVPVIKGLIQKNIKTVLLQGQTDIEDNPLSVMKWLDDVNPEWSNQQLKPLQQDTVVGFQRKKGNSWFWFVHRNGKYIRSPSIISRIRSWLI